MAYTTVNFKNKKALKDAVKAGQKITLQQDGPFPPSSNGIVYLEGPWFPKPHTWYARATMKDGVIVKVE